MASATFNYADLIGLPYKRGARGPDAYDCYGLVREMLIREGVKNPPDYLSPEGAGHVTALFNVVVPFWKPVERQPGAVVYMRLVLPGGAVMSHCGYMLDDNKMIHSWEQSNGVCTERVDVFGHRVKGYYRHG